MKKFLKFTAVLLAIIFVISSVSVVYYYSVTTGAVEFQPELLPGENAYATVLDADGQLIDENLIVETIKEDNLPKNLVNAFIALEDKRFYSHNGLDYYRIGGAILTNIKAKDFIQGASTISQQLIKNTHLSQEKTISRKLKEFKLVRELEKNYSKNEIMAMYLNIVYFGSGIYGVGDAAREFFNKSCNDLTVEECATLAAVVKNPENYSPLKNIDKSTERRNLVLTLMQQQGYISENELETAKNSGILLNRPETSIAGAYINSAITEAAALLNVTKSYLKNNNYVIKTYYNTKLQANLNTVLSNESLSAENSFGNKPSASCMLADNSTSGIIAYCSSDSQNAYEFRRQAGSAIKPLLVYTPAFQSGLICPATPILDDYANFNGYTPSNYNNTYYGWVDVRTAVKKSLNIPAVKVLDMMGTDIAMDYADKMNIKLSPDDNNLNLALGGLTDGITFVELTGGFMTLANGGSYSTPTFIKSILKEDNVVYNNNLENNYVFSEENAFLMTNILLDTVKDGTSRGLNTLPYNIAAKTGTVAYQGVNRDAYNVSYTTEHTLLVWHGNTEYTEEYALSNDETGGSYTTTTAKYIWQQIYKNKYPDNFTAPEGIVKLEIDSAYYNEQKLLLATEDTPLTEVKTDIFNVANAPSEYADTYKNIKVNYKVDYDSDYAYVKFNAKQKLIYEVYKKGLFGTELIDTVENEKGLIERQYSLDMIDFFSNFYVRAYYINRYGEKVYDGEKEYKNG